MNNTCKHFHTYVSYPSKKITIANSSPNTIAIKDNIKLSHTQILKMC